MFRECENKYNAEKQHVHGICQESQHLPQANPRELHNMVHIIMANYFRRGKHILVASYSYCV